MEFVFHGVRRNKYIIPVRILKPFLLASLIGSNFGSLGADELFVYGKWTLEEKGRRHYFFFKWNNLPSKVSWKPESEVFPINLRSGASEAESVLIQRDSITNQINLARIRIHRLAPPSHLLEQHNKRTADFAAQWFVEYYFYEPFTNPEESVVNDRYLVTLLDGTRAVERGKLPGASSSSSQQPILGEENKMNPVGAVKTYKKIQSPDFELSKVQWNSKAEEFPLNLKSEVEIARARVAREKSASSNHLVLQEISIESFLPSEVIRTRHLNLLENLGHWLVVFRFCEQGSEGEIKRDIYMLLDGTILEVTR